MEAGAASYLAPLWTRWAAGSRSDVLLGPAALQHLQRLGFAAPPQTELREFSAAALDASLAIRPALLVASATGAQAEAEALALARRQGVPTVQVIDTWHNYAARFLPGAMLPDRIAVIDLRARAEATAEGLPADRLAPVGHPAWERAGRLPSAPLDEVLFVGQPIRQIYGERLGYDEHSAWALCQAVARRRPDLIRTLRYLPHPAESVAGRDDLTPDDLAADPAAAFKRSGTVLGMFSSLMVDALLGGRRVVSVQPDRRGPDPCSLHRHGHIGCAATAEQLETLLSDPASRNTEDLHQALSGSLDRLESLLGSMLSAPDLEGAASS